MYKAGMAMSVVGSVLIVSGCATRPADKPLDELPPTEAGQVAGRLSLITRMYPFLRTGLG